MKALGFHAAGNDSVPWWECFSDFVNNEPGISLAGARHKEDLTQVQLSKLTDIPQRHIPEMENGKRSIGKEAAKKLAMVLNLNFRVFFVTKTPQGMVGPLGSHS